MTDDMEPPCKVRRIRVIGKLTKDGKDKEVFSMLLPTTGFKTLRCNPETGRLACKLRLPDKGKPYKFVQFLEVVKHFDESLISKALKDYAFENMSMIALLCNEEVQEFCRDWSDCVSDVLIVLRRLGDDGNYNWIKSDLLNQLFFDLKNSSDDSLSPQFYKHLFTKSQIGFTKNATEYKVVRMEHPLNQPKAANPFAANKRARASL